jgi:hypothetical protein
MASYQKSEVDLMRHIQIEYGTRDDIRLLRNNVGVLQDRNGTYIRFGLCSGSSDLIGWKSVVITPEMVGKRVAVFTAIEVKSKNGVVSIGQNMFLKVVREAGGLAGVARSMEDAEGIVGDGG